MNVGHHDARRSGYAIIDQLRPCPSVAAVADGRAAAVDARHEPTLSRRERHPYLPSIGVHRKRIAIELRHECGKRKRCS